MVSVLEETDDLYLTLNWHFKGEHSSAPDLSDGLLNTDANALAGMTPLASCRFEGACELIVVDPS